MNEFYFEVSLLYKLPFERFRKRPLAAHRWRVLFHSGGGVWLASGIL